MKVTQVVRRRLALLLSAVLILTSIPMQSMAAFSTDVGEGWKMSGLELTFNCTEVNDGKTATLTLAWDGKVASPGNASPADATPANATQSNAAKQLFDGLTADDFTMEPEGYLTLERDSGQQGNKVTFTATATNETTEDAVVTVTLKNVTPVVSAQITIKGSKTEVKLDKLVANPTSLSLTLNKDATAEVEITASPSNATIVNLSKSVDKSDVVDVVEKSGAVNTFTVTAKKEGKANITFTSSGGEIVVPVTVTDDSATTDPGKGDQPTDPSNPDNPNDPDNPDKQNGTVEGDSVSVTVPEDAIVVDGYQNLTEQEKAEIDKQIQTIKAEIEKDMYFYCNANDYKDAILAKAEYKNKQVKVEPEVSVKKVDIKIDGKKAVVTNVRSDIDVLVVAEGVQNRSLAELLGHNVYVKVRVRVPSTDSRGDNSYVWWTHYTDKAATKVDNTVLKDVSVEIDKNDMVSLETKSFSILDMTFKPTPVQNSPSNPNSGGSSSGGSGSSVSVSGASQKGPFMNRTFASMKQYLPSYVVDGSWVMASDGTWTCINPETGMPYVNGWAAVYNPYTTDTAANAYGWFRFDANGKMLTGWFTDPDTGLIYYLNPISNGDQGKMVTGWNQIEGKWYYFSNISDGTRGHLLVNTTTPDGYVVGADGAWIQ